MYKSEFLDILKQSLVGEISPDHIEENIKYYDQYINSNISEGNENIMEELGDPRLIAKTIIESERMTRQKGRYPNRDYQAYQDYDFKTQETGNQQKRTVHKSFLSKMKWQHKLIVILSIVMLLFILLFIGRFLLILLRLFGVPIMFILIIYFLFRKRKY